MERLQTDVNLQEAILNCLDSAMLNCPITTNTTNGPFSEALQVQAQISWLRML
jgi:hypothetical protein